MITLFSTHKNFTGIFDIIQTNALNNWRSISPDIQIIIIGNSKGSKEIASSINADYVPEVKCSPEGTPLLEDLFRIAQSRARNPIMIYVNADIILPKNFLDVVTILSMQSKKFMAVGHRWDLDVVKKINFNDEKECKIFWSYANKKSKKHACTGIDYFIFRKSTFKILPSLAIGRFGWDNWLLWKVRRMRIPLIDLSNEIFAIHQEHSYCYDDFKSKSDILNSDDGKNNQEKTDGKTLNLLDTNYHLVNGEIEKKRSREYTNRNLGKLPIIFPEFSLFLIIYKKFYRRVLRFYDIVNWLIIKYNKKIIKIIKPYFYKVFSYNVECNICGWRDSKFLSDDWHQFSNCPNCYSKVRHRLFWFIINNSKSLNLKKLINNKKVLHFAPDKCLVKYLAKESGEYVTADINIENDNYDYVDLTINMENMNEIKDEEFDCVIAFDVLEHIPNHMEALKETKRILKHDGYCIFMIPQPDGLATTYEDLLITDGKTREILFGDKDHLRNYGDDFKDIMAKTGFEVIVFDEKSFDNTTISNNVLYPPILSDHPLATNNRRVYFGKNVI